MEKDFYNDDFDSFLQQKADEYLMYPSESVWKKIRTQLFWRKNWISVAGSVLFLFLLFFIPESFFNSIFVPQPASTDQPSHDGMAKSGAPSLQSSAGRSNRLKAIPGNLSRLPAGSDAINQREANRVSAAPTMAPLSARVVTTPSATSIIYPVRSHTVEASVPHAAAARAGQDIDIASHFTTSVPAVKDSAKEETAVRPDESDLPEETTGTVNWLEDLALIRLTPKKGSKFNLQFYFSPLVSYRNLTDNDFLSHNPSSSMMRTAPVNVNQYVDHVPSIGVELGSNILYKVSKNLTLKTGLQLNYSRYTIKAYKAGYEKASIALNSWGRVDTLTSYTTIRNFNGYLQEQLQNQYVQVSVPIGAEFKILGNKRFQLNVAGTVQPTFLLFNDTYLLSTDYINYTKEPSLVRRWNVHTSAEAYISYQFANVRWQVGPQFRYQMLSSYNDRYPIREYLMEYGIKFGISKTLR